jgi:outer membrane biosynthesis protein TonB
MVFANLRREERIGLGIALALHVALAVAFLAQPSRRDAIPPEQKMTVNLSTDVGLEATAPEPVPESAAAIAPTLAPEPAPPQEIAPPVAQPIARPQPIATTPPRPKPVPRTTTAPKPKPPVQSSEPRRRPDAPASQSRSQPKPSPKPAGGSRIGADFLPGQGSSTTTRETRVPASQIGASAKASIVQALARQIRPEWQGRTPEGPDAEKIVTILAFDLNEDGSLAGTPRLVRQEGINELNRNQAARHVEAAIKAVKLAAPFDLPAEYYAAWKRVSSFRFDRRL